MEGGRRRVRVLRGVAVVEVGDGLRKRFRAESNSGKASNKAGPGRSESESTFDGRSDGATGSAGDEVRRGRGASRGRVGKRERQVDRGTSVSAVAMAVTAVVYAFDALDRATLRLELLHCHHSSPTTSHY
jgi:hypothetical protein